MACDVVGKLRPGTDSTCDDHGTRTDRRKAARSRSHRKTIMNSHDEIPAEVPGRAAWLRRSAEPSGVIEAARALWTMEQQSAGMDSTSGALPSDLDVLIPAWIARLLEQLVMIRRSQQDDSDAFAAGRDLPPINIDSAIAVGQLEEVLRATRERIDPHVGSVIERLGTLDPGGDDHLMAILEHAGPAVIAAVPKLLNALRTRGITRWPSHLARALANASRFDERLLPTLRDMLSSGDEDLRVSAMEVLGTIGAGARSAAGDLLALRNGSERERCGMIDALARLGTASGVTLDALDAAMGDPSGYVRRCGAHALGELTPEPARFVPMLIGACDWTEHLHDEGLPEAAVAALAQYGPRAVEALPRLRRFVEGPIKGRTVRADLVRDAIARISGEMTAISHPAPRRQQTEPVADDEPLFAVRHQGRPCYIDRLGRIVLRPRYSSGEPFSEGRAIVFDDDGRTFVIDRQGREVFRSDWDEIRPFSEGLAAVMKDRTWGFVDRDGRVAVEPRYDSVTSFSEGLAGFELGREMVTLRSGITWTHFGPRGFLDRSGNVAIPADWADARGFREGRAVVCAGGTWKPGLLDDDVLVLSDRKYGYIDRTGRLVIAGGYDLADRFSDGLAVVQIGDGACRARYGYIDQDGEPVVPLKLTSASAFRDGVAVVHRRGKRWRGTSLIVNRDGEIVRELPHLSFGPFSEGLLATCSGEAYGFVDIEGRWVVEPQFDQVNPFEHGLAEVQRGDWYGLIDKAGRFVWGPTTEGALNRTIESDWAS